jgi:hypothetical protein
MASTPIQAAESVPVISYTFSRASNEGWCTIENKEGNGLGLINVMDAPQGHIIGDTIPQHDVRVTAALNQRRNSWLRIEPLRSDDDGVTAGWVYVFDVDPKCLP